MKEINFISSTIENVRNVKKKLRFSINYEC